jgi:hypothetical protein
MKKKRLLLALLSAVAACAPSPDSSNGTKSCGSGSFCASGYYCGTDSKCWKDEAPPPGGSGNGETTSCADACPTGLVCERYAPANCLDPNWNEWPIPNNQVDVNAGAPNPENYTNNRDGTITDNITELMWQQSGPAGLYTWSDSVAYCPTLTLAGHNDWRLPSVIELMSIVDIEKSDPAINSIYFPSTPGGFWSATPAAGSPSQAWYVDFNYGEPCAIHVANTNSVLCVR